MIKYKLTNQDMQTHNGCQWVIGKKKTTNGEGELCSNGWLHAYHSADLAVLLNPIHAAITNPRLFEVECGGEYKDDNGLKCGFSEMTLIKEIELPVWTRTQKNAFAILCAKEVYKDKKWNVWADNWLSGQNRSEKAAAAAREAAEAAHAAAAREAAEAAHAAAARAAARAAAWAAAWAVLANAINFNAIIQKAREIK